MFAFIPKSDLSYAINERFGSIKPKGNDYIPYLIDITPLAGRIVTDGNRS